MNIYLSLPMTGVPIEDVKKQINIAKEEIMKERPGSTICSPLDACSASKNYPYSMCMGLDIMRLLECDAVCMCPGWESSKGCNLEYEAAKIYDKVLLFL